MIYNIVLFKNPFYRAIKLMTLRIQKGNRYALGNGIALKGSGNATALQKKKN